MRDTVKRNKFSVRSNFKRSVIILNTTNNYTVCQKTAENRVQVSAPLKMSSMRGNVYVK
jgi:hypothetical protein